MTIETIEKKTERERMAMALLLFLLEETLRPYLKDVNGYYFEVSPALPYQKPEVVYEQNDNNAGISIYTGILSKTPQLLLKVMFSNENSVFHIPNIMVHESMKYNGVGKAMIQVCLKVAGYMGCKLELVEMTDSFLYRMLKRGAKQIGYDSVEITENTDLSKHLN